MLNTSEAIVKKPWGQEYSIYENPSMAMWLLQINPNQKTSLHCHPKKKTGLIVLNDRVRIHLLEKSFELQALSKIMIRNWMFHRIENLSSTIPLFVVEVETPNEKGDLIRVRDDYGRKNKPFEGKEHWEAKSEKCFCIANKKSVFSGCFFEIKTVAEALELQLIPRGPDIIVVLEKAAFKTQDDQVLCDTGEVLTIKILKLLDSLFISQQDTKILHIYRDIIDD